MTARVPDAGQRVVLGHDGDRRPRAAAGDRGPEGGGQPAYAALDARAVLLEELGEPRLRLLFLEGQLGRGVDAVGQRLQLVGEAIDGRGDVELQRVGGRAHLAASNSARARFT